MAVFASLYLFVFHTLFLSRRFHPRIALVVFGINLTVICLTKVIYPLKPTLLISNIYVYLVAINLLIFLIPKRWLKGLQSFRLGILGKILLLIPMTIIIFIGCLEWLSIQLVHYGVLKTSQPMITVQKKGNEDWRMTVITSDKYRIPDPVLLWRNTCFPPYNSQGFKGPVVEIPKPDGVYRIICYGDSNTDGTYKEYTAAWPGMLHEIMNRNEKDGHRKFEVLNAGVAGYSSYQGLQRFREEVDVYEPDLVLVSFGWNDVPWATGPPDKDFIPPSPTMIAVQRILLRYQVYRCFKYYVNKLIPFETTQQSPKIHRVSIPDFIKNLADFVEMGRERGIVVVLLTRPYKDKTKNMVKLDSWRSHVPEYNKALLKYAIENNIPALDIQTYFENKHRDLFIDQCHFGEEGNKTMAELINKAFSRFEFSNLKNISSK